MRRRWWILVAVSLATFMGYLDNNVTNVAIPTIQRNLHLSVAGLEWVVGSYILVFASLLLLGGRMADLFGRRRLFLTGLTIFTLASLAAGLASDGSELIAARVIQGLGAALLVPTTLAIIMATFDNARERTRAIGIWTAIGALALGFGPLIGGVMDFEIRIMKLRWKRGQSAQDSVTLKLKAQVGDLSARMLDTEERCGLLVPPIPPRSGLNLNKRSQVIRMSRRGEQAEKIAASLNLPQREVELLLKVYSRVVYTSNEISS
jgi:hypothetical protein